MFNLTLVISKNSLIVILTLILRYTIIISNKICKCATNYWDFQYIKYATSILILFNVYNLLFNILTPKKINVRYVVISSIVTIANILYIVAIFTYLNRTKDCKCSKRWEEKLLHGYGILLIVMYTIFILMSLSLLFLFNKFRSNLSVLSKNHSQ